MGFESIRGPKASDSDPALGLSQFELELMEQVGLACVAPLLPRA